MPSTWVHYAADPSSALVHAGSARLPGTAVDSPVGLSLVTAALQGSCWVLLDPAITCGSIRVHTYARSLATVTFPSFMHGLNWSYDMYSHLLARTPDALNAILEAFILPLFALLAERSEAEAMCRRSHRHTHVPFDKSSALRLRL